GDLDGDIGRREYVVRDLASSVARDALGAIHDHVRYVRCPGEGGPQLGPGAGRPARPGSAIDPLDDLDLDGAVPTLWGYLLGHHPVVVFERWLDLGKL